MKIFKRVFIQTVVCILAFTCFAKTISVFQHLRVLDTKDFLFYSLSVRKVMAIASLAEFGTVVVLLNNRISDYAKLTTIAWLASAFIIYRASGILTGEVEPCPCLGNIYGWFFGVSRGEVKWLLNFIALYLLVGSYTCICWEWNAERHAKPILQ